MTREEAISLLRRYRRDVYRYNEKSVIFPKRNAHFKICVYGRFLVDDLIRRIAVSYEDPIKVVSRRYSELDEILGDSDDDHFETHAFAALMEYEAGNVLRYLETVERKKNEDAKD